MTRSTTSVHAAAAVLATLALGAAPAAAKSRHGVPDQVTVSGVPQVGEALRLAGAMADGSPLLRTPPGHVHWERCNAAGTDCHRIPGAHRSSYVLRWADRYHRIRVRLGKPHHGRVVYSEPTEVVLVYDTGGATLVREGFDGPDGLVANDYTYRFPAATDGVVSPIWQLSNGSLFSVGGIGWTGAPDNGVTRADGSGPTHSASFRLTTKQDDFRDVLTGMRVRRNGLTETSSTPAVVWDGAHIVLRYQSLQSFYVASVDRRDGLAVLKRKLPGGDSYGGNYRVLGRYAARAVPQGAWQDAAAVAHTNDDGSVTVGLFASGHLVVSATDRGENGAPLLQGRVGVYGDNADLNLDDIRVSALR